MISTIDDMIGYFAICLANADEGGNAEMTFIRYIKVLAELKQIVETRRETMANAGH